MNDYDASTYGDGIAHAQLAGLEREHRWGGWDEEPFTPASGQHVSVYRKAG